MSRRRRRREKERKAQGWPQEAGTLDLMQGIIEGKFLPLMRPQDARRLLLSASTSGFAEEVGEDLSPQSCNVGLTAVAEFLVFVGAAVAAVMSIGWWSIPVVLGMTSGLAIVRLRSLFGSRATWPLVLLVAAGMAAAVFLARYGPWHSIMAVAVPLVWLLRRFSYRLSERYVTILVITNPAAFSILFASGRLALVDTDKLEEAQKHGSLEDYPLLITARRDAQHD